MQFRETQGTDKNQPPRTQTAPLLAVPGSKSAVSHADEFKQLHEYYTTRADNPLKKMQSLIVIACKILRIVYTILKTGTTYDRQKMLKDIKRPVSSQAA